MTWQPKQFGLRIGQGKIPGLPRSCPLCPNAKAGWVAGARVVALLIVIELFLPASQMMASDHADPIRVRFFGRPESNLTGLFVFEQNDRLVIALCARPGLAKSVVDLAPFEFCINIDVDSQVSFADRPENDQGRTNRYGGHIQRPETISEDVQILFRFQSTDEDNPFEKVKFGYPIDVRPTLRVPGNHVEVEKLERELRSWVGLRDDPFILHGFSTTNVVAMVVELPFEMLGGNDTILVWGTSRRFGKQIDHVGRSLRTMLPRFDFLNQLHPRDHVREIRSRHEQPGVAQDVLSYVASPVFGIRHYDPEPDVVIFSRDRWRHRLRAENAGSPVEINGSVVAFSNGRRLTDDVAWLMCQQGDCLLFEVSTADAHADHAPRPTTNGSPFLDEFPYLAAPNEHPNAAEQPSLRVRTIVILSLLVGAVLLLVAAPWWLWFSTRRRLHRVQDRLTQRTNARDQNLQ